MTKTWGWTLAALLLFLPSVVEAQRPDPGPLADARRGIDRGNAQYIAAFARANANCVAQVYDADGARLSQNGEVLRDRQAIARDVRELLDSAGRVKVKPKKTAGGW